MRLTLMTLNTQGFRNPDKQREVLHFARRHHVDLLLLQETNFHSLVDVTTFKQRFAVDCFFSFGSARSEGVGVVILRDSLVRDCVARFDVEGRVVSFDFFLGDNKLRVLNVYGPANPRRSNYFYENLHSFMLDANPVLLAGDFNCVLDSYRDVRGPGVGRSTWNARELRRIVEQYHLTDAWVHIHGDTFMGTWSRAYSRSRLDRVYVPEGLVSCVERTTVLHFSPAAGHISDHGAVLVTLDIPAGASSRSCFWRLDVSMLHDTDIVRCLEAGIASTLPRDGFNPAHWDALKDQWESLLVAAGKRRKAAITHQLNDLWRRMRIVKRGGAATLFMQEYLDVLRERYYRTLRFSSRTSSVLLTRRRPVSDPHVLSYVRNEEIRQAHSTRVQQVVLADGTVSNSPSDIVGVFSNYFADLFSSNDHRDNASYEQLLSNFLSGLPQVPNDMCEVLSRHATLQEVHDVVFKMKASTSPGPDGLPVEYYKTFWPQLGPLLTQVINFVLDGGFTPSSYKCGRIVLVPKDPSLDRGLPQSWRPITLLNVDYKILASLVATRFREVLPYIISPYQTCSVLGRSIFSSLSMIRDLLAYINARSQSGAVVSLDQAKAFDRVFHCYIIGVLRAFGFPSSFVRVFQVLYSNLTSDLIVNGHISAAFPVNRGVRQGCPLSPMIFVLCLDPLLRRLQCDASIHGFTLPNGQTIVGSAYADDITLFLRDKASLDEAFRVLDVYSVVSGAKVNASKSRALAVGGFCEPLTNGIAYYPSIRILGVFFDGAGVSSENWPNVVDHIQRKVAVAQRFNLSLQERAFLIKCVFPSKLWYISRIMLPPPSVCTAVTSLMFTYFWGSRIELVRRDVLRQPRSEGGWSLPCVATFSKLLALRSVLQLLEDVGNPGRVLTLYWLGPSRRALVPRGLGNLCVAAPTTAPFYHQLVQQYVTLQAAAPQVNILAVPASRLCERLCATTHPRPNNLLGLNATWKDLTADTLPRCVSDFQWRLGWSVLPTRDRLQRRRVTNTSQCPNCSLQETNIHVVNDCVVARTFWTLVARLFCVRHSARRHVQSRFALLVISVGRYVLWKNRCRAIVQRRPIRLMYPLLKSLRLLLVTHLEEQLVLLGEAEFLRKWSTRFVQICNNRVSLTCRLFP